MKHTLQQVFRSGKFIIGFVIFTAMLLIVLVYPLIIKDPPLTIIGQGTFFPPGIYVNVYDSIGSPQYTLMLDNAASKRIDSKLTNTARNDMKAWLVADGIPAKQIDVTNSTTLMGLWEKNYDPTKSFPGMTFAKQSYYQRLDASLKGILSTTGMTIAAPDPTSGTLTQTGTVAQTDYVNLSQVPSVKVLPLGTDNFGRDVLRELVTATGVSLEIGLVAGIIATSIGLIL